MASEKGFENLSNELFESIIDHIKEPRELSILCLVSRTFYHRVVPTLYQSWSYRGLEQPTGSIRSFLQTILARPDLASHVRMLDIREWGKCPHLEDNIDSRAYGWMGPAYQRVNPESRQRERELEAPGDEEDGDYEDLGDEDDASTDSSSEDPESEIEEGSDHELGPLDEGDKKYILRKAASNLDLEDSEALVNCYEVMHETDDDELLVRLISLLPNLRTMFIVMPDNEEWYKDWSGHITSNDTLTPLAKLVKLASEDKESTVLKNLETVYISSALHIGPTGHRQYELQLGYVVPFFKLENLRSLYTLTPYTNNHGGWVPIDWKPYNGTSNITTLVFDEANLTPEDAIHAIGAPKALKTFQWSDEFICFSPGSCTSPFHSTIGNALREEHADTLEDLDLDIIHKYCTDAHHLGNPHGTTQGLRAMYESYRNPTIDLDSLSRPPQDSILIGSLRAFHRLTTLAIDVTALCGHQKWSAAPIRMIEALPESLQILSLRVRIQRLDHQEGKGKPVLDDTLWVDHFLDLVQRSSAMLPWLRKISILVMHRIWPRSRNYELPCAEAEWVSLFEDVRQECVKVGLEFSLEASQKRCTTIPYFQEQSSVRKPGRD